MVPDIVFVLLARSHFLDLDDLLHWGRTCAAAARHASPVMARWVHVYQVYNPLIFNLRRTFFMRGLPSVHHMYARIVPQPTSIQLALLYAMLFRTYPCYTRQSSGLYEVTWPCVANVHTLLPYMLPTESGRNIDEWSTDKHPNTFKLVFTFNNITLRLTCNAHIKLNMSVMQALVTATRTEGMNWNYTLMPPNNHVWLRALHRALE